MFWKKILKKEQTYPEFESFMRTNNETQTRSWFVKYYENERVVENRIFYESFQGAGMTDSPYAFFLYVLKDKRYSEFQHIWAVKDLEHPLVKKYEKEQNIKFVEYNSEEYIKALCGSKYLISNNTFLEYFIKKDDQVYVNTWHGTPIKTLGKDIKGSLGQHRNLQRNLLHCDYFINPNKYTADILLKSCDVDGAFPGKVADIGYPREDWIFNTEKEQLKDRLGIEKDKRAVLYAPTWRGELGNVSNMSMDVLKRVGELKAGLPDDCVLLLKLHHMMNRYLTEDLKKLSIPEDVEINQALSITDVLITDYSSVFFDYMVTGKPILFYAYDLETYENDRGLYVDMNKLPGPVCRSTKELIDALADCESIKEKYNDTYNAYLKEYSYNDDGRACERLADLLFHDKYDKEKVYSEMDQSKARILSYAGAFINNGITNSIINLSRNIDYTKYDIYLILDKYDDAKRHNIERLDPRVKVFYKIGNYGFLPEEYMPYLRLISDGIGKQGCKPEEIPVKVFEREKKRLFGNLNFQHGIDYSGYTMSWVCFFAYAGFPDKIIYQHNDMKQEMNRVVNGRKPLEQRLKTIFTAYDCFDKLVSVSESVEAANKISLAETTKTGQDKTFIVENTLDPANIKNMAETGFEYTYSGKNYFSENYNITKNRFEFEGVEMPKPEDINFVCIARLSWEKGQKKLIQAFEKVNSRFSNVKLYLIGDGPLRIDIQNEIRRLNLEDNVVMTGHVANPFYLLNHMDCFVLSSNHEGQGLAVLEAMVVGKYCISTDIDGPRSFLKPQYGELVENSVDGLANAMISFAEHKKVPEVFDYDNYNYQALTAFYKMIEA